MTAVVLAAMGLAIGGPVLALVGGVTGIAIRSRPRRKLSAPSRAVLLVILVELRSGNSILAALRGAAEVFSNDDDLVRAYRVATVSGLVAAAEGSSPALRPALIQLARAQKTGASMTGTMRALIETDIAAERARRLSRARALPVRMMVPITLLLLPGLMLIFYAPGLIGTLSDIGGRLT
jgi:hypothetical protein